MVAKISVGSSLYGALAYNGNKVNEGVGRLLTSNKIFDSGTGEIDISRAKADFEMYMPSQLRTEKPIVHISLNPHPDDQLTDTDLAELACEYMERLGYGEQPYIVFKHDDISRQHVHIVSLRVDQDGKLLNNDFIHRRSKRITDDMEKRYNLHPSKGLRDDQLLPNLIKVDTSQGDVKRQVASVVRYVTQKYRFQNMGEYRAVLSLYNVTVEETRGVACDREYYGLVYSVIDDNGDKIGNPFKSSRFGKYAGYSAMESHFAKSKSDVVKGKLHLSTRAAITTALNNTHNRDLFVWELKSKGIDVIFRESDEGRIYGTTYIDHNTGCVLNGSRMGKDLSANALWQHFNSEPINSNPFDDFASSESQNNSDEQTNSRLDHGFDGFGLGMFDDSGDDPEEEQFRRAMQRKKRKRVINYKL